MSGYIIIPIWRLLCLSDNTYIPLQPVAMASIHTAMAAHGDLSFEKSGMSILVLMRMFRSV